MSGSLAKRPGTVTVRNTLISRRQWFLSGVTLCSMAGFLLNQDTARTALQIQVNWLKIECVNGRTKKHSSSIAMDMIDRRTLISQSYVTIRTVLSRNLIQLCAYNFIVKTDTGSPTRKNRRNSGSSMSQLKDTSQRHEISNPRNDVLVIRDIWRKKRRQDLPLLTIQWPLWLGYPNRRPKKSSFLSAASSSSAVLNNSTSTSSYIDSPTEKADILPVSTCEDVEEELIDEVDAEEIDVVDVINPDTTSLPLLG